MPDGGLIRVSSVQRLCVSDGPGVRTVVFLKGCHLRCPWCCNPEAVSFRGDPVFDEGRCPGRARGASCAPCELCGGRRPRADCPWGAFVGTYRDYGADELYGLLMRDRGLYAEGGGVTFSGGDPLFQAAAVSPLLDRLRGRGVHVALETSLYAPRRDFVLLAPRADLWLVDLKFQWGRVAGAGRGARDADFESNLSALRAASRDVRYRMVVMGEALGDLPGIVGRLKRHGIRRLEILPYHALAEGKYRKLHRPFRRFTPPDGRQLADLARLLEGERIEGTFLSV